MSEPSLGRSSLGERRLGGLLLFLLGAAIFVSFGTLWEHVSPVSMLDFKGVYYGSRCLLSHCDPYNESALLSSYQAQGVDRPTDPPGMKRVITLYVNLPTAFLLTVPFAMLPWGAAHMLWMACTGVSFVLAAYLMWSLCAACAPRVFGALIGLFLVGSELLLEVGNAAGITVSLCAIAVWCLLKERFIPVAIVCFALALAVKPHVAGLVWLYFLLAGGIHRRRALQILAVNIALCVPMVLWVTHVAPHWLPEMQANLHTISAHGAMNDPGPASVQPWYHGAMTVSLQTVFSVFRDEPAFYNAATYIVCVPLLLAWAIATLRARATQANAWLALAAITALSMLPIYHRQHDSRLLLLTFPACAMLWAEGGALRWIALAVNSAAAVFTADTAMLLLGKLGERLHPSTATFSGRLVTIFLERPAPLVLLAMSGFYLWVYWKRAWPQPVKQLKSTPNCHKEPLNKVASGKQPLSG